MTKRKYNNVLDIPLSPYLLSTPTEVAKQRDQDLIEREAALFQEYGLSRPDKLDISTRKLIQQMAIKLKIKGFMESNQVTRPGRPDKWKGFDGMLFVTRVQEAQKKHPKLTLNSVINNVRKEYYPDENQKSLYVRYNELLNDKGPLGKLANMIKNLGTQ